MWLEKAAFTAIAVAVAAGLAGCGKMTPSDPKDGWSTATSMSGVEYALFLTQETATIENVLMTRAAMATAVMNGEYEAAKELENAKEAESKLASVVDEITVTMPAMEQESDRINALDLASDALEAVRGYEEALESGDERALEASAQEMRACMIASSGAANVPYE